MVWRPAPGWVAAAEPLPGTERDPESARALGLAFAEGRDLVPLDRLARLADERPAALRELPGDFGFVLARQDTATAVRSCGGTVPFYVFASPDCAAATTRLEDLPKRLALRFEIDSLTMGVWSTGWGVFPDDRSFLSGVKVVPRGHAARLRIGRPVELVRYWDPQPAPRERLKPSPDHGRELRAALLDALGRDLDPEGANLLTLSGGVDSSVLAALAAGRVGRELMTLTLVPPDESASAREKGYVDALHERYRFRRRWFVRSGNHQRVELLRAAPPVLFPVMHPALWLLPSLAAEERIRVLVGGENADDLCGSELSLRDWAGDAPLRSLLRAPRRIPEGRDGVRLWLRVHAQRALRRPTLPFDIDLEPWIDEAVRAEYREWRARRRRAAARRRRPHDYVVRLLEADGFLAMNWEVASRLGIRRSVPFMSRRFQEAAFRWHPDELWGPGTKELMRRALRDDVPALHLGRRDKGGWQSADPGEPVSVGDLPEALQSFLSAEWRSHPPESVPPALAVRLLPLFRFAGELRRCTQEAAAATFARQTGPGR